MPGIDGILPANVSDAETEKTKEHEKVLLTNLKKVKGFRVTKVLGAVFSSSSLTHEVLDKLQQAAQKKGADAVVNVKHSAADAVSGRFSVLGTAVKLAPKESKGAEGSQGHGGPQQPPSLPRAHMNPQGPKND